MSFITGTPGGTWPWTNIGTLLGAAGSRKEIYDYSGRLTRALHFPALVLPTHWDNFTAPFEASHRSKPQIDALQSFVHEVNAASPKTEVIVPKYFEAIALETAAETTIGLNF